MNVHICISMQRIWCMITDLCWLLCVVSHRAFRLIIDLSLQGASYNTLVLEGNTYNNYLYNIMHSLKLPYYYRLNNINIFFKYCWIMQQEFKYNSFYKTIFLILLFFYVKFEISKTDYYNLFFKHLFLFIAKSYCNNSTWKRNKITKNYVK